MDSEAYSHEQQYDTSINIIGSIKELDTISNLIKAELYPDIMDIELVKRELGIRTEKSISRVEHGVKKAFLSFVSEEHEQFFYKIFGKDLNKADMSFILYWQLLVNNPLFREITSGLFVKYYFEGRVHIETDDVLGYVVELKNKNGIVDWSESTIKIIANKYLNLMVKFGFLEKKGRKRVFVYVTLSPELQVIALYFSRFYPSGSSSVLSNELAKLSFIPQDDLVHKYKKLSKNGLFDMSFNGEALAFKLNDDIERVIDVLYG